MLSSFPPMIYVPLFSSHEHVLLILPEGWQRVGGTDECKGDWKTSAIISPRPLFLFISSSISKFPLNRETPIMPPNTCFDPWSQSKTVFQGKQRCECSRRASWQPGSKPAWWCHQCLAESVADHADQHCKWALPCTGQAAGKDDRRTHIALHFMPPSKHYL